MFVREQVIPRRVSSDIASASGREAFGTIHSEDVITARMPSQEERERLDLPTGTPVLVIKGGTRDDEGRALHYIEVTGAGGRVAFEYRY